MTDLAVRVGRHKAWGSVTPIMAGISGTAGVWTDVTPAGISLAVDVTGAPNWSGYYGTDSFGVFAVCADPTRPGVVYAGADCQGIWKSFDYGLTWAKWNTGTGGSAIDGTPWYITIPPNGSYVLTNSGYGSVLGIYRSTDGGSAWTLVQAGDYTSMMVDPTDSTHCLCTAHSPDDTAVYRESTDSGVTWVDIGASAAGIGALGSFLDSNTVILLSPHGLYQGTKSGTWTWTLRLTAEGPHGGVQMYRDAVNGYFYVGILFEPLTTNRMQVYRTTLADRGVNWTLVSDILGGGGYGSCTVFATPSKIFAQGNYATHGSYGPHSQSAPMPAGTSWVTEGLPAGITNGAASAAVMTDGSRYCIVTAHANAGLWRLVI